MEDEIVVLLPVEFYSEHGVVVQLEKVMAALAIHGIKYERCLRPPKVSLRDGINALRKNAGDYDFDAQRNEQLQNEQQNIPENIPAGKLCALEGCAGKHLALGLCRKHYDEMRREDPEQVRKFRESSKRFYDRHKSVGTKGERDD